ncbi:MAG: hypothetical protein EPN85_04575 [Bacteroidetes bacterium]|nr:MAG: hypothetical protein EPN85_04575 [Bacteroidota bacterium]
MIPSEGLFHLIHALSKTEKRFFKLSASIEKGEKLYLKLFDLITSQRKFNEDVVLQKIGISKSAFAFQKNYLHNLILHRMAFLHSGRTAQLRTLLTQAEFLYNKGLYAQEKKILRKAKKQAAQLGLNNYLMEILDMEYSLAWKDMDIQGAEKILKERQEIFSFLDNEHGYYQLYGKLSVKFSTTGVARSTADMNEIKKLMNDPLLTHENKAVTFYSRQLFYQALQSCNIVSGDIQKAYLFAKKKVDLYLANPEKTKHSTVPFLITLYNLILACSELKKHDEEKHYLDLLSKHSALLTAEHDKSWVFFIFHFQNMNYHIKTGQFEEASPLADKLYRERDEYKDKLDEYQNITLYFKIAVIWFGAGEYNKCVQLMNFIRNKEHTLHLRPDMESALQIFHLVAHFEKGNRDLLPRLSKAAYSRMTKEKNIYKFEGILLDFFITLENKTIPAEGIPFPKGQKDLAEKFKQLKKELLPLANDPYEKAPMQEFDFISWIGSKIEKRSFAEVVREKAKSPPAPPSK